MSEWWWQVFGMALLLVSVAAGYGLVRRRAGRPLTGPEPLAVATLLATTAGGFWGAFAWWPDYPGGFSWDLPPLASRMLAAAGWAFAFAGVRALAVPTRPHLRQVLAMLALYLVPLALAIVTLHRDRFDPAAPITWAFFIIVGLLSLGALVALARPAALSLAPEPPAPAAQRRWLAVLALVAGVWGLAMFLAPAGPIRMIWIWPQDPLTSRLIASMLMTLALAAWLGRDGRIRALTALGVTVVYGTGIALAGLVNLAAGKPAPWAYILAGALAAVISVAAAMRPASSSRPD